MRIHSYKTRYCSQNIEIEYEASGGSSPTTYSPLNGADGGDSPELDILSVTTESGLIVLYTSRQAERWYNEICETHVEEDDDDFYD
mgnify:CR=1 FL=1